MLLRQTPRGGVKTRHTLSLTDSDSDSDSVLPDFDVVGQQPAVDGLGGVSHEGSSFEAGLLQEPGQSSTVVQVEAEGGGLKVRQDQNGGTGLSEFSGPGFWI